MLYTGYFANTKKYIEIVGLIPVSVAGVTPEFFTGPKWTTFAPRKEIFYKWKNKQITNVEYMDLYVQYLGITVSDKALENIKKLSQNRSIIMCCYEKNGDFCHRHTLAKWLGERIGENIKEFIFKT